MNILIDIIPDKVLIEGKEWDINTDFRTSILFEMLIEDDEVGENDKLEYALNLYYPTIPSNLEESIDKMLWFYRCGKDIIQAKGVGTGKNVQVYSYEYDSEYIYSAFLDQYNIDLQDIEYLHWWKFKAMFKSLKEDNEIVKIMQYRGMDLTTIKDKDQKEYYKKLKELYEIPRPKNEVDKNNALEEALLNGGDISNIL